MPPPIRPEPTLNLSPEADAKRWRDLIQYLTKLERHLAGTLPLAIHQRGPIPGWLNAAQIGPGPGMKSSMHLNMDGNQPGVAPRLSVTDATGQVRFEDGNLAVLGSSPAQYGWRVIDGSNNPLADSQGLIDTLTLLGVSTVAPASTLTQTSFSTTGVGMSFSFTLTRTSRCKFTCFASLHANVNGKLAYMRINLVGVGTSGAAQWGGGATTSQDTSNAEFSLWCAPGSGIGTLAAGSYTVQAEANNDATGTAFFAQGYLVGELLGH